MREYRRALCVVLPSVYRTPAGETKVPELLGQTLLEGMACGAAAICTDVASMPEVVEDGVTGFVVPPNDPAAIGERLAWLARHRERAAVMGAAGRAACCANLPGSRGRRAAWPRTRDAHCRRAAAAWYPLASRHERVSARHRRRERLHRTAGPRAGGGRRRGARVVSRRRARQRAGHPAARGARSRCRRATCARWIGSSMPVLDRGACWCSGCRTGSAIAR